MHQHNSRHMWWMLAGCVALPFILFLFAGNGGGWRGNWLIFGLVALCIGSYIAMMFGWHGTGHGNGVEKKTGGANTPFANDEQTHTGSCH